jgi:hypothetical protein
MQQRNEPDDSLDDYPTPPWGGRALCDYLHNHYGAFHPSMTCWEPAANRGFLVRGLKDYFGTVTGTDVHDYGAGYATVDFLFPGLGPAAKPDWIITNPPFRLAEAFAIKALSYTGNVALLVRSAFLEGQARYEGLFREFAPGLILQFTERLPMNRGICHAKMTTATAYCWLVWSKDLPANATRFDWIAPCRKRLEKAGDYDTPQPAVAAQ